MADFFVSYTASDRTEAQWIARELERLGHVAHVHEWEIEAGDDILAWMQARHDAADHVLCVVSDAYMAAPYSTLERNAALWASATRPGFALFVVVKPCRLPTLADHYRRCDIAGLPEPQAQARLAAFLARPDDRAAAGWLPEARALSNVPVRSPRHFVGRDADLAEVDAALSRYRGRVAITAVHGLRGVGKTTLAAAYALRHAQDYRATWWIRAQTADGMRADLVALGVRLGWIGRDEPEAAAFNKVMERLRHEGEGLLLIYDNALDADSLRPFLPNGGAARVLVTSNAHAWRSLAEPVELRLWPREIGADYFVARLGGAKRAEAEALSEALGGLPLAHEQAAAYCERLGVGLAEYLRRLEAAPIKLLDAAKDAPAEYHDRQTVAKTFALAIEEAGKLHPAAEPLIVHAALLAPEPIPLFLFQDGREALGEPLASELADDGLEEALAALRTFALVSLETVEDDYDSLTVTTCFRLHRLVRETARARCPQDVRKTASAALLRAMAQIVEIAARDIDAESASLRVQCIQKCAWDLPLEADKIAVTRLVEQTKAVQKVWGPDCAEALSDFEMLFGLDHPIVADCLLRLRPSLDVPNDFADRNAQLLRALSIREGAFGKQHKKTLDAIIALSDFLNEEGDVSSALGLALHARELSGMLDFSPSDWDLGRLLGLAQLLERQGESDAGREVFERVLLISEQADENEQEGVASLFKWTAHYLVGSDRADKARRLLRRAVAIYLKARPSGAVANDLSECAVALMNIGENSEARSLLEMAMQMAEIPPEATRGERAIFANNLARALMYLGDFANSEPLFLGAVAEGEVACRDMPGCFDRIRANYARLLVKTGRAGEALPLAEAALSGHLRTEGSVHPWSQDSARVLAEALDALGRNQEAAKVRQENQIG